MKTDIVCLQETHASSHDIIKKWLVNSGYRVVSSCYTNKSCGTAILIKDCFHITKIIKDDVGRFVQAIINFGDDQLSFASIYAPNKNPKQNKFLLSLADLIDLSRPVFLAGEFNNVLDPVLDRKRRPSFVDGPSARFQESGVALQSATIDPGISLVAPFTSWAHCLFVGALLIRGRMGLVPLRPGLI